MLVITRFSSEPLANMAHQSLLVVHQGALGDFVTTFPAMLLLKDSFPRIDAICHHHFGKLASALNVISAWYPLEAAYVASLYSKNPAPRIRKILAGYDSILLFAHSKQLADAIRYLIGRPVIRIAPKPDIFRKVRVSAHLIQQLVRRGLLNAQQYPCGCLNAAIDRFPEHKGCSTTKEILIHPGSGSKRKNWPFGEFCRVAACLASEGWAPEYLLGPAEHDLTREFQITDACRRPVQELSDLQELVKLLRTVNGFIGNDSGVAHLAAFLGLPTLVIFGPSDPDRWLPAGRAVTAVRPQMDCSPCFESQAANCDHQQCLRSVSAELVLERFQRLIDR